MKIKYEVTYMEWVSVVTRKYYVVEVHMYKVLNINTMEEILALVADQPFDNRNNRHRGYYLYRGLPNVAFELKTSLQRNCGRLSSDLEPKILANFSKYTAIEAVGECEIDTIWKKMILGQHHGLPTRLLDWTHSPFIALHFATDGDLNTLEEKNCVIWRIDIEELHSLLQEPFQVVKKREGMVVFNVNMLNDVAKSIEEYDSITEGKSMVIMEPPSIDPRIVNQYAFFSVIPKDMINIEEFLDQYTKNTIKYIIDKNLKWRIRDFLDEANISERIVYPGLDGICKWLSRHYFVKNDRI